MSGGLLSGDAVSASAESTSGSRTNPDGPAVTPTQNDALIWSIGFQWTGPSAIWGGPTNYTLRSGTIAGGSTDLTGIAAASRVLCGGSGAAENPGAFSGGAGADDTWEVTGAFAPEPAGGGGPVAGARFNRVTGGTLGIDWGMQ
jgi:hypothetical protein